ncbi:MAG TPA: biotin-dependent carboxyltransferase family protein [Gemmatimonadaceae bacterium]|nr:biotin-dependent carboxyltransferase family protein [Gemmatimonadaceae bacterium]
MITVRTMAGFATVQDEGRAGYGADAIPRSGAMDVEALALANALVGNARGAAAIEWTLAGGTLAFDEAAVIAVAGARAKLSRSGAPIPLDEPVTFHAGDELRVERFVQGAFIYVAMRGGIDVPLVLGSRSTYLPAALGGLEGRRIRAGDVLQTCSHDEVGSLASRPPLARTTEREHRAIRVIEGPDSSAFSGEFRESFWSGEFTVSRSSSRAGYRLDREPDADPGQLSLPSSPACVGAIQVPDGKSAIVLMPDGPTVGGYPKIGVVASVDLGRLAQRAPGETVAFERVSAGAARTLLRATRH